MDPLWENRIIYSDTKPKERRTRPDWRPLDWILVVSNPAAPCGIQQFRIVRAWACRTGQGNREASGLAISLPASRIGAGKSRGLRPADRSRAIARLKLAFLGREIARHEACRSRSARLRPRDCPAPIREAGREIARHEACRSGFAGLRPRHFPAPVYRPQASRFPLAISLPRSAGLRPRDFPAQICTPHAPDNPEFPSWIQKKRRKNSPVAMSPPRTAGSLHTSEAQMKAMNHRWHLESTSKSLQKGSLDCKPTQKA